MPWNPALSEFEQQTEGGESWPRAMVGGCWGIRLDPEGHTAGGEPECPFHWYWRIRGSLLSQDLAFELQQTRPGPIAFDALLKRVACHLLAAMIPDRGLDEAIEALGETIEFHRREPRALPELPSTKRVQARIGKTLERPDFHAEE